MNNYTYSFRTCVDFFLTETRVEHDSDDSRKFFEPFYTIKNLYVLSGFRSYYNLPNINTSNKEIMS